MKFNYPYHGSEIAIIGVAARFPGANSVEEFWTNLFQNRETIRHFTESELVAVGINDKLLQDNNYVKAKGIVDGCNDFDAAFFGYSDREAALMDPQLRLYHECAWHALEDAGYVGEAIRDELIGVFGGASANALWTAQYAEVAEQGGAAAYEVINVISRDFFNSRLAYKLNLKGPAVTVQTACSTALVAVHQACQSLLSGDSDVALAGAVSLSLNPALHEPEKQGYLYQEGMILSPDGHCRPFDQTAQGTVLSDGVGFVVLKRLDDAVAAGDRIYAVIKGSAINNDGNDKIGYTAPSAQGQRDVIAAALQIAGVEPDSVGYIEAHGTGTHLGDPIELQGLISSYQGSGEAPCYIGSVKGNLGHLDTAAGMAGLIKAVFAIKQGVIPASLHFSELNQKCDLRQSRLKIAAENQAWRQDAPLRAAISSFGIGGTNAHVIIEEYPSPPIGNPVADNLFLLPLSAKTDTALGAYQQQLQQWLPGQPSLVNIAHTLVEKRVRYGHRQALVADASGRVLYRSAQAHSESEPNVYWMFSGQGAQYVFMGQGLYRAEPLYRATVDECLSWIHHWQGPAIHDFLFGGDASSHLDDALRSTDIAQLALFVVEYALARLLLAKGVNPKGLIGHSLGEYVAACLAGVFSLGDALRLIIARGKLMVSTAPGAMVAVHHAHLLDLSPWPELCVAATNTAQSYVISGPVESIGLFTQYLTAQAIEYTPLRTSHAFHSGLMEPILVAFAAVVAQVQLHLPTIPMVSNLTGNWIEPEQITTADYWVAHLRQQVQFHQGLGKLLQDERAVLIEVGPGKTLAAFARQHPVRQQQVVLHSLRGAKESEQDTLSLSKLLAELYALGVELNWPACNQVDGVLCSLPGYAFDRKTYLPKFKGFFGASASAPTEGFYREHWRSEVASELLDPEIFSVGTSILVLREGLATEELLIAQLESRGLQLIQVFRGNSFQRMDAHRYQLRPELLEDYIQLGKEFARIAVLPAKVLMLWQANSIAQRWNPFAGLLLLVQAFSQLSFTDPLSIYAVTEGAYAVAGDEAINPDAALSYGAIRVIGQEYSHIQCHLLDIRQGSLSLQAIGLASAICSSGLPLISAVRGDRLWLREFDALGEDWQGKHIRQGFIEQGVYIITGGFGGLGAEVARFLAREYGARLVLNSRHVQDGHPLLNEITLLGGVAIATAIDMSYEQSANQLFDAAIAAFGRVNGVIHTAGLPGDTMIQRHQLDKAKAVINTKVAAAEALVALVREYQLDVLVFFSSVTGILGGLGQIDYCAANACLDAVAERARTQGLHQVYSIRWDAWRETGMAVDALNGKVPFLARTQHPLLGDLIQQTEESCVYRKEISTPNCWVLSEHWVMGTPTIPGTTYLEMAGAAYTRHTGWQQKSFNDIYFLSPLSLKDTETADIYTQLSREVQGFRFEIGSYHRQTLTWRIHARGQITTVEPITTDYPAIPKLKNRLNQRYLNDIKGAAHLGVLAMGVSLSQAEQDALMKYGPRWSVVKEVWIGVQEGLARLQLSDDYHQDLAEMALHPAILDCALSYLRAFIDGGVYIPISYLQLTQWQALPADIFSRVTLTSPADGAKGVMSFNIQLLSIDGALLADIREFTLRRIEPDFISAQSAVRDVAIPDFVQQTRRMQKGLGNAVALRALAQIVCSTSPLALVTASDFIKRYQNADQGDTGLFNTEALLPQESRARPEISVEFVAPKTDQQKQLAEIWQQMLGFDRVGIQDDFFELGGDSLLLMQIHKKIQTLFGNHIAVVELYNHPTIQRLTEHLSAQQSNQPDAALVEISDRIEKQKAAARRRRERH